MNGVNCFERCNSFLRFVTCGMLGSDGIVSGIPVDLVELTAVNTVSQVFNDPNISLERRSVTPVQQGVDQDSLTNLFIIT